MEKIVHFLQMSAMLLTKGFVPLRYIEYGKNSAFFPNEYSVADKRDLFAQENVS